MGSIAVQVHGSSVDATAGRLARGATALAYIGGLALALGVEIAVQAAAYHTWRQGEAPFWPGYFLDSTLWTLMLLALPAFWIGRPLADAAFRLGSWAARRAAPLASSDAAFALTALALPMAVGLAVRATYFAPFHPEDIYIHDEASYLFQSRTFLAGRLYFPSPPVPEPFDSFHVVNSGRMASRYFPGTGLVLLPFVALGAPWLGYVLLSGLVGLEVFLIGLELGDRPAARLAAVLAGLSPALATFTQILEAHLPTTLWLLLGILGFLRSRRRHSAADAALAGLGLALALMTRPLTAFGVAILPAVWFLRRVVGGQEPAGWSRLAAMCLPVAAALAFLGLYNRAITGRVLYPPYLLYTDTYSPRHRYGFANVTRARQEEAAAQAQGRTAFPRRNLQKKFVDYDRWADDVRLAPQWTFIPFESPWFLIETLGGLRTAPASFLDALTELPVPLKKLRMRWMGMSRGTLGTVACTMALLIFCLSWRTWTPADRLLLAGLVGLQAVHFPFAFEGIDWVGYVFEAVPLMCLLLARVATLLAADALAAGRRWLVVWLAVGLSALAIENHVAWLPERFQEIAATRAYYQRFRQRLEAGASEGPILVFIRPGTLHLHRSLVFNDPGLQAPVLRAWHINPLVDWLCASYFPDRRCFLLDEDTEHLEPLFGRP